MISLILGLVVVGIVLYLVETQLPIDPTIKLVIRIVVVICVIYYLIGIFGLVYLPLPRRV